MAIEHGEVGERLLGYLSEKFRPIMEEAAAASGKSLSELIKPGFATKDRGPDAGVRVIVPGELNLAKHPEIKSADLPKFLIVEHDLVVTGDQFFALTEKGGVNVDGNIVIKDFNKAIPKNPDQTANEYLADTFNMADGCMLNGKVVLEKTEA